MGSCENNNNVRVFCFPRRFRCGKDGRALFSELITLAEEQPPKNLKEASFKIGHRMDLHGFIVPVQARFSLV